MGTGAYPDAVPVYALNLFDLAENDDYRAYSRRSVAAVAKHGGEVTALGRLLERFDDDSAVAPRRVMIVVEWPSEAAFRAFLDDPEHADLHPLRERGTGNYLWWLFEKLDDLRPMFAERS
jgi:uncharacterized protein (DUF1330 family)